MLQQLTAANCFYAADPEDGIDEDGRTQQRPTLMSSRGHLERQRRGARPPSLPPSEEEERVYEYGSQQADQAAQKLQSLGAMVYPPGNKDTIDWGILAGAVMLESCSALVKTVQAAGENKE